MKTEFELDVNLTYIVPGGGTGKATAKIIGKTPKHKPYVAITLTNEKNTLADIWIKDKDLKLFAKNILKSLGE